MEANACLRTFAAASARGVFRLHLRVQGAWSKVAVVAREDDSETMLNHAFLQARRRGDI